MTKQPVKHIFLWALCLALLASGCTAPGSHTSLEPLFPADSRPSGRAGATGDRATGRRYSDPYERRSSSANESSPNNFGSVEPANYQREAVQRPASDDTEFRSVRGQNAPGSNWAAGGSPTGSDSYRQGMPPSGARIAQGPGGAPNGVPYGVPNGAPNVAPFDSGPNGYIGPNPYDVVDPVYGEPTREVPFDVYVEETRTGRFVFGVGVNSDAGVTGQIVVDERNFDITRPPTSFDDVMNGTAFRGAGQGFRMEALPGDQVQRYMVQFTEPYLLDTQLSLSTSGSYFDRRFFDWDEQRVGGRVAIGHRLTPDLSVRSSLRGENVKILNPRVATVPELNAVVGSNDIYGLGLTLAHDTRDVPFAPTEGHLIEMSFEQVMGTYDYSRAEIDYRQHFLMRERPDGSGRHTLTYMFRFGVTGSQTPIFENYYAGGFSTLRGFDFRGASPVNTGVIVGGEMRFLGSVEYMFPLTADDMMKGVIFTDFGTVEEKIQLHGEDYRVAVGAGLRIAIPALGPAPLALDFAFPLAKESTDDTQTFSFFFGLGRG
ncbi:MAG: BamA/TamA family outer membrane protein [Pirellulaceae bacterium]|jgi:outer membrane protein insertion porin family|nr:BamA/TamA family outer membrane protein [Pirellulaceae bacterium]MDP7015143.1 BamA/TamA family outer membrane protein [Pirellulaceae bacterium]